MMMNEREEILYFCRIYYRLRQELIIITKNFRNIMISWLIFVRSDEQYQKAFEFLRYEADLSTFPRTVIKGQLKLKNGSIIQGKVFLFKM
jgi:hypothetical protein